MGLLSSLGRARRGNITVLAAGALTMLVGFGAIGVDVGSMFLAKRRLQGVADAAALAAAGASDQQAAAQRAIRTTGVDARIVRITPGRFDSSPTAAADARFVPGTDAGAVRVTLAQETSVFFGATLTGESQVTVAASATATKVDLAAFSLGSRLAAVNGGLPGALLSALAGSELSLSVMDYNALASAEVDLLAMSDALRTQLRLQGATYDEVLATRTTLPVLLRAAAAATTGAASSLLTQVAARVPATRIVPAQLLDLGRLLGGEVSVPGGARLSVDAFGLLRESLTIAGGARQVTLDLGATVPGLLSTQVALVVGDRMVSTPWIAVGKGGDATVTTSQMRLLVDARVGGAMPLGITALRVPLVVELAQARATLDAVGCAPPRRPVSARLLVTPSPGAVSIAAVDPVAFRNLSSPLTLSPASIVALPLIGVQGQSTVRLGGTSAQAVSFTASEIASHQMKTVSSNDLMRAVATSLIGSMRLQVSVAGLGINLSAVTATLGSVLNLAAPALDGLLTQVTGLLGVGVGQADVRIDGVRCGAPMLIG